MLRFALLVLLMANAGYFAWTHGWMATLGWAPAVQSEPYRLQHQVRPDVLSIAPLQAESEPEPLPTISSVVTDGAIDPAEDILPETTVCLQSENMDEAQAQRLQHMLHNSELPANSWEVVTTPVAGRWMVYLGKFPNETSIEKRRAELRNLKIGYDRAGGDLEPGLSLGRFSTEEAATRELRQMLNQGVRGARVVQERAARTWYALRLPHATLAQRQWLQSMPTAPDSTPKRPPPTNWARC